MELWELGARESIRDLVARYNANGDTGRFAQVIELFAPDAVIELDDGPHTGHDEIMSIFAGTREHVGRTSPTYVRHFTSTHQIDVVSTSEATGRCYFQVITTVGLDHWGRYIDRYRIVDGRWRFAHRRVTLDGRSPNSLFPG